MISKDDFRKKRILVVGDVILDRYWHGIVNRISPEAPVPIVRIDNDEYRLGGAANVAVNVAKLGVSTSLLGIVGNDVYGNIVKNKIAQFKINDYLVTDKTIPTTVKLRVLAQHQQLIRIDFESFPLKDCTDSILKKFESNISKFDVVVISDYAKGALNDISEMICIAKSKNIPVLVDPKGTTYQKYSGATIITPNKSELALVVGKWCDEQDLIEKVQKLRDKLKLKALLLTRSEEGMTLFSEDRIYNIAAQAREVFDVSGAGDTVIAITACMLAVGFNLRDSVQIANRAAGLVVGKLGTASVSYEELFGS